MLGRVPSFARCFFHFQRNSGFMKILYSLLKYVCVCVCVCVCAHALCILGRQNLSKTAGFDQEFSAVCHPYFINSWETVIKCYPHLHLRGTGLVRKSESPWEAGPPVKRTLRSSPFLLLSSPAFTSFLRITDSQKWNLLSFSQAVLHKHCFSLPSFWKTLRGWEAGIIFPVKYLEYLQCSYFRLPGKSRASV